MYVHIHIFMYIYTYIHICTYICICATVRRSVLQGNCCCDSVAVCLMRMMHRPISLLTLCPKPPFPPHWLAHHLPSLHLAVGKHKQDREIEGVEARYGAYLTPAVRCLYYPASHCNTLFRSTLWPLSTAHLSCAVSATLQHASALQPSNVPKVSHTCAKEPCVSAKESYMSAQVPEVLHTRPTLLTKSATYLSARGP